MPRRPTGSAAPALDAAALHETPLSLGPTPWVRRDILGSLAAKSTVAPTMQGPFSGGVVLTGTHRPCMPKLGGSIPPASIAPVHGATAWGGRDNRRSRRPGLAASLRPRSRGRGVVPGCRLLIGHFSGRVQTGAPSPVSTPPADTEVCTLSRSCPAGLVLGADRDWTRLDGRGGLSRGGCGMDRLKCLLVVGVWRFAGCAVAAGTAAAPASAQAPPAATRCSFIPP